MLGKQNFRVSNRKVRLLVGLILAGLLCVQCTTRPVEATKQSSDYATFLTAKPAVKGAVTQLDKLARTDHVALLRLCLDHYLANDRDYTCTFLKQERMGGKLRLEQEIQVKFLEKPFSVCLTWVHNRPSPADRLLYVDGKYDNMMLVRPAGLLAWVGTQKREPAGEEAMKNTLRPVTSFGFHRSLQSLINVYAQARKAGDSKEEFGGYARTADGRNAVVLIRYLPPKGDYPAWKTLVYIDTETLLPIMLEAFDWDKKLSARYIYRDLKLNTGLSSADFTPEANAMTKPE